MVEAATLSLALLKHFMILVVPEEHCNLKRCCEIQVELLHVNFVFTNYLCMEKGSTQLYQ